MKKDIYEERALLYAERYGIINYKIKGCRMIYYCNYHYPVEGNETVKCVVDLRTIKETRTVLKKYYKNIFN